MPKKTKEQKELEENKKEPKKVEKKANTKKPVNTTKKSTTKSSSTTKKAITTTKSATKKTTTTKVKVAAKKSSEKKSTASQKTSSTKKRTTKKKVEIVEYYDLPYRYNQTVVKVLAQTPTNLFIYWDISDKDRKNFEKQYGDKFFETTKPVLIVHNDTLGYHFEVEINDFANSWYLYVADSKSDYRIELGRRPINKIENSTDDYIYITSSNEIESPNDRVLFDRNQKMVYFRNVKTGLQTERPISSISFIRNMGKFYSIYDLYKAIYQDENIEDIFDLSNPSSGSFSSRFK